MDGLMLSATEGDTGHGRSNNRISWPPRSAYPKRYASVTIVFGTCFGLCTIVLLPLAGARERRSV